MAKILIIVAVITALGGCSFRMPDLSMPKFKIPRVHKITVQQGNVITQDMIDRLQPGMTRSQVAFIMGEPVIRNTFNSDRWDYIYTVEVPGYFNQTQRLSVFYENDLLAYFTGDYAPSSAREEMTAEAEPPDSDTDTQGGR